VDGLAFKGNKLLRSFRFPPFHPRKYGFTLLSCKNVTIAGNTFSSEILGKTVLLESTPDSELSLGDDQPLDLVFGEL
jgi:polygalacturonase